MTVEFVDMQQESNPKNRSRFRDREELVSFLNDLLAREPFFFELKGENGFMLTIGIGKNANTIQFGAINGEPPYLMAVAAGKPESVSSHGKTPDSEAMSEGLDAKIGSPEFLCGGTATPVPTRYCVPFDVMRDIAIHFLHTGGRHPDVRWEQI
jgi:hypothetical protein